MIYLVTKNPLLFSSSFYTILSIEESLEKLDKLDSIGFDSETTGLECHKHKLFCIQMGNTDFQIVVDTNTVDILNYKELLEKKELLMHNAKFDLKFLFKVGIFPNKVYDSFLVERILTTGIDWAKKSLYDVTLKYCEVSLNKATREDLIINPVLNDSSILYAADDVKYLHKIKEKQMESIKQLDLTSTVTLDNEFVIVLAYVEFCGFYLNWEEWEKKCDGDFKKLKELEHQLNTFILDNPDKYPYLIDNQLDLFSSQGKTKINWASSKQVIPFMQSLGVETKVKDKKTGRMKDSVDKKVISSQVNKHPIIKEYIKYTEALKVVSTYGLTWKSYITPSTGRIHTNFNQIMSTGRMSSGKKGNPKKNVPQLPNLQNIPSDTITRHCFQAQGTDTLIVSDYSGQEQIILANRCLDENLLAFYSSGEDDMHSFVCKQIALVSEIFPIEIRTASLKEIKNNFKKERQISKSVGFSINYGGTGITISQNANVSLEAGELIYKAYFAAFPGLANYFKEEKAKALKDGYITFNYRSSRKCFLPYLEEFKELENRIYNDKHFWTQYREEKELNSDLFKNTLGPLVRNYFLKKGEIERMSLNYPIQGSSSDTTKLACIYMYRYIKENNLLNVVKMVNIVHDRDFVVDKLR